MNARTTSQLRSRWRSLLRAPTYLYRWHLGWLFGHRFLMLTHVGRRSGLERHTVLEVIDYRPSSQEAVVMSGFGASSDWLQNIQAVPRFTVTIGSQQFPARFRFLSEDGAMAAMEKYQREHALLAPLIRYVLSRLLGWTYLGSEEDRRRMVRQLPLIAFRPRFDTESAEGLGRHQ